MEKKTERNNIHRQHIYSKNMTKTKLKPKPKLKKKKKKNKKKTKFMHKGWKCNIANIKTMIEIKDQYQSLIC